MLTVNYTCFHILPVLIFYPQVLNTRKHINILCTFFILLYGRNSFAHTPGNNFSIDFIQNKGQLVDMELNARPDILYYGKAGNNSIFLKQNGMSYVLSKDEFDMDNDKQNSFLFDDFQLPDKLTLQRIDIDFIGSSSTVKITSSDKTSGYNNYFLSHCSDGITNVESYNKLFYQNIYNQVDIIYYGGKNQELKYNIIVNPGGNCNDIQLKYSGANNITLENGELHITTSFGEIKESMPRIYQHINGKITDVKGEYMLHNNIVSFKVANYDKQFALVIDPWVTFFGGTSIERGFDINTDHNGDVVFTGYTSSANFPVSPGAFQVALANAPITWSDICVTKFNSSGNRVWATYIGGSQNDMGKALDIDLSNNVFVTGFSDSPNFPIRGTAYQSTKNSGSDMFILKLNSAGTNLIWSTFYGGSASDNGIAIAIDNNGDAVIAANVTSTDIASTAGSYQSSNNGNTDIFITKFTNAGARIWSTYYGGSLEDYCFDIDTDNNNDLAFTGYTKSNNYPVLNSFQSVIPSAQSAYVTKLNGSNGFPVWSTFTGGPGTEYGGMGIVIDGNNNIIATGNAFAGFPVTAGCFQPAYAGLRDIYVLKIDATGNLVWSTFVGGNNVEDAWDVTVDAQNDIYVSGDTYSRDFPVTSCAYSTGLDLSNCCGGQEDGFLIKFDSNGQRLCASYLGGLAHDEDFMVAEHGGLVYLMYHASNGVPVTAGAFQTRAGGLQDDVVLMQLCGFTCGMANVAADFSTNNTLVCAGTSVDFSTIYTTCDSSKTNWLWSFPGGNPSTSTQRDPTGIVYNNSGTFSVQMILFTPCDTDTVVKTSYINVLQPYININSITSTTCLASNGAASVSAAGGWGTYSYTWLPGGMTGSVVNNLSAGTFSVTVTDNIGCTAINTITINNVQSAPSATITTTDVKCYGESNGSASVYIQGGTTAYTYSWSNAQQTNSINNLPSGNYTCTITDNNGCSTTAAATILQPPLLIATISSMQTICAGETASLSSNATGGTPGYNYTWDTGQNTSVVSAQLFTHAIYSLTITDANNCSVIATTSVNVNPLPIITFTSNITNGCGPLCINFINTTLFAQSNTWDFGDGNTSNINSPEHCYDDAGSYPVTLFVTDNNGCSNSITLTNYVTVYPNPVAGFISSPSETSILNSSINFIDKSVSAINWDWKFGDQTDASSIEQNPNFTYDDTGTYRIRQVVTNEFGCSDTAYGIVTITPDFALYTPNTFTPNNDNINDAFLPIGAGIDASKYDLYIFDRWGNLIFHSTNPSQGWNGHANNGAQLAQEDTYVWKVVLKDVLDKKHSHMGHVNLIR